jgi:hypothetical protein
LKSTTPALFAIASGFQCFALGSTYWASRGFVLQAWETGKRPVNDSERVKASAIAGGLTGGVVGFITRGRSNAIPGVLGISFFGAAGQAASNWWFNKPTADASAEPKLGFWGRMVPMKHMSNEEYAEMLKEKRLRVEVEISIIDDKIAALRQQPEPTTVSKSEEKAAK